MKIIKKEKIKLKTILLKILNIIFFMCILLNIVFLLNTTLAKNEYFQMFGISFFKMSNELMKNDINQNDLVIVKKVDESELQEGDIIAYEINENIRINKIVSKKQGYITKSNQNFQPDIEKVTYNQIIGKKITNIKFLGALLELLQSKITSIFVLIYLLFKLIYNKYIYITKRDRVIKKNRKENVN